MKILLVGLLALLSLSACVDSNITYNTQVCGTPGNEAKWVERLGDGVYKEYDGTTLTIRKTDIIGEYEFELRPEFGSMQKATGEGKHNMLSTAPQKARACEVAGEYYIETTSEMSLPSDRPYTGALSLYIMRVSEEFKSFTFFSAEINQSKLANSSLSYQKIYGRQAIGGVQVEHSEYLIENNAEASLANLARVIDLVPNYMNPESNRFTLVE